MLSVVCLAMTAPRATLYAADPAFVGVLSLASEDAVAKQIGLTDEIRRDLRAVINRREDEAIPIALRIKDLPPAEQTTKLAPFVAESERLGLALLNDDQRRKLEQVRISRAGLATLAEPQVAEQLKLTDEQKAKVATLAVDRTAALSKGDAAQRRAARDEYERQLAAVLEPAQRAAWEALAGQAAAVPIATPGTSGTSAVPGTPESRPAAPASGDGKLRFNFRFAPWKDVLDWFAQQADLSLVTDTPPQGTFNYTDNRSYTPAEAIDLLNSVLLTKGYTLVMRGRMVLLVNLQDGVPPNLVTRVEAQDLDKRGEFELVSSLFSISRLAPEEAEKEIAKLLGPQGTMVVLPKSRQILVTETAGKLRTIRAILEGVENQKAVLEQSVRVFELKTVTATEVLPIARPLLGMPADKNEASDGSIRIAVDPLETRLFVSGKPEQVSRFEEILTLIDQRPGSGGPATVETPQLEVYGVEAADPASVLQVMQTLLAGLPDVRLATDPVSGNLVALARPSQHATIKETLAQLQREAKKIEVMQLHRVDASVAVLAINKLFATPGEDKSGKGKNAPVVEADPQSGQLMVRGTEAQIGQIRSLLQKLGEEDTSTSSLTGSGGNVRVLPFSGRSAREALEQIENLWPALRRNQIRVVTPSAVVPTLRHPPGSKAGPTRREIEMPGVEPPLPATPTAPAAPDPAAPATPSKAATRAGGARIVWVSEPVVAAEPGPPAAPIVDGQEPPPSTPPHPPAVPASRPATAPGQPLAEIVVAPGPGGIVIASEDTEALDDFERLFRTIVEQRRLGPQAPTIFYLRYARADVAAELVQQVLTGQTSDKGEGGGSLLGDIAKSALGDVSGNLVTGLLGLGGGGGGGDGSTPSGNVHIVPDTRLNALIVHASPIELDLIEQLLKVIDQEASPETVQTVGKPRLIPVFHTSAEQVATVVRQVYANRIISSVDGQRQPTPEDLIRALRGGRGGSSNRNRAAEDQQKMTVGVDTRSNALVVSAPEPLFVEVKALVEELDQPDSDSEETVEMVNLKGANAIMVQRTLAAVMGAPGQAKLPGAGAVPGAPSQAARMPSTDQLRDQIRRRMEAFNQMPGARGGSNPFGGGNPFGSGRSSGSRSGGSYRSRGGR
jgi:type II secretory pathway component GspD/PulD (secretin)